MAPGKERQAKEGQETSEADITRKRREQAQRKKPILLRELENELKNLDDMDEQEDLQSTEDPCLNDETLARLKTIASEAARLQIGEIEKLSRLAIGKRILNLQLKKKKDEHNAKLKKKEKIELFFRQNRIKRYDYATLYQKKVAGSTLVARAYDNGKGFQESGLVYRPQHTRALAECEFTITVREANRIFYSNYSGNLKSVSASDNLLRVVWLPTFIFVALGLTLPFASFPYEELLLLGILIVVVVVLAIAALLAFLAKPSDNNQIEQSIEDIRDYFQQVNQRLALQGKRIEWLCPTELMYLEVVFHDGLPT